MERAKSEVVELKAIECVDCGDSGYVLLPSVGRGEIQKECPACSVNAKK
ncbi:MAG: hypothetical protein OEV93_04450 [Candidatus Moranbacteria bacterium]|nr:hypothetical protein [Candidatus Moranbacteria bacterium]